MNKSDKTSIDYSIVAERNLFLEPLCELFCDKIFVFTPIDEKFLSSENKEDSNPSKIPGDFFGKSTANIKFAFNYMGLPINKNQKKPTGTNYIANEIYLKCTNDYVQKLREVLDTFPVDEIFEKISNPQNFIFLNENNAYVIEIDFTQGFGVLLKKNK